MLDSVVSRPAAIYCRISDDAEGRRLGVDRQERTCRRLAEQRGWSSVEVYIDNDLSAFSGVLRPAYRRMLDDLQLGRLVAIVAWDGDRLHRSTRELEDFIDLVEEAAIPVVMVTSGELDFGTATGRMQARIKGTIARYESEHKTERISAAMAGLAEAGRWKGGPRPYGYDVYRDVLGRSLRDGRLQVVPEEAAIIVEAAARAMAGETMYGLCKDLNVRDVPTTQGARWRTQTLRRVLTNPTTVGKREYRGQIVANALWPPILDEQDWQQLRDRLLPRHDPDHPGPDRFRTRTYLLTGGLAVCGVCGSNLHAHTRSPSGARAYNCMSGPDKEGCGGVTCSALSLDHFVTSAVLAHVETAEPAGHPTAEMPVLAGITELAHLFAEGHMSSAAWQIVQAGVEALDTQLAGAADDAAPPLHPALLEQWALLPLNYRRERIGAVLDCVVIHPTKRRGGQFDTERVELRWRR